MQRGQNFRHADVDDDRSQDDEGSVGFTDEDGEDGPPDEDGEDESPLLPIFSAAHLGTDIDYLSTGMLY